MILHLLSFASRNLAIGLETANPRTVSGSRIDDNERPLPIVDLNTLRRVDANESVVHRPLQLASVGNEVAFEF